MRDTTQICLISQTHDVIGGCAATFSANGALLFADIPLGSELPDEFGVTMDGDTFSVVKGESGHCVCDDDRDAFTAHVFG